MRKLCKSATPLRCALSELRILGLDTWAFSPGFHIAGFFSPELVAGEEIRFPTYGRLNRFELGSWSLELIWDFEL